MSASEKRILKVLRVLSVYVSAGFRVDTALKKAGEVKLAEKVSQGIFLSDALESEGFPSLITQNIKVAEESGELAVVLKNLTEIFELHHRFLREMRFSLFFPLLSLSISILIFTGVMVFLVPEFAELFSELGVSPPESLGTLLSVSEILQKDFVKFSVLGVALFLPALPFIIKGWEVPFRSSVLALISRAIHLCLENGIDLQKTFLLVSEFSEGKVKKALVDEAVRIMKGKDPEFGLFSGFRDELARSYDAGEISRAFLRISKIYEEKAKREMELLRRSAEPVIFILTGLLVVALAVSLYIPLVRGLEKVLSM